MSTLAEDGASCESGGKGTMPKAGQQLHGSAWARGEQVRDCHRAHARRSADFGGLGGSADRHGCLAGRTAGMAWGGFFYILTL